MERRSLWVVFLSVVFLLAAFSFTTKGPETTLVAALDGTIYLLASDSLEPLWSFSSGPEIYSSYHASSSFIDCDDNWELYAHNSHGKRKLMKSLKEYSSSTPEWAEDGGIVIGDVITTIFSVNAKTGMIIHTYGESDSSTTTQSSHNEKHQSGSDLKTDELLLDITRMDYKLASFMPGAPKSSRLLWNMSVAEIGVLFVCEDMEESHVGLRHNTPLDSECESIVPVYRLRNHNTIEALSMPNGLPRLLIKLWRFLLHPHQTFSHGSQMLKKL